ncbi:hypothetical protein SDC9_121641 [bioreactor metagenome]|uniref:Uncharacterized protein n=1 Tax=bioreactor metagenome TaxID=1076179 RepID=A0A645CCP5_9ZZZZ
MFLKFAFFAEHVDVVHQQHVDIAQLRPEGGVIVTLERLDKAVENLLASGITHHRPGIALPYLMGHRVQQMGLAGAGVAVNIKRIEHAGAFRGAAGGGVGIAVFFADHEIVESIT